MGKNIFSEMRNPIAHKAFVGYNKNRNFIICTAGIE